MLSDLNSQCASADLLSELCKKKLKAIEPESDIDAFMTADTAQGKQENILSELTMHLLGLDASPLTCELIFALGSLF